MIHNISEVHKWAFNQHDVVCNQKYGNNGDPYSHHLKYVIAQAYRFRHLVTTFSPGITISCACHDLIEDARISYNDLKQQAGDEVAETVFLLTENKGKTREERHNEQYYTEIAKNEIATFVKLCDILANVLYSLLSGSSMLKKYKSEYPKVKRYLYTEKYKEMFIELESLLKV